MTSLKRSGGQEGALNLASKVYVRTTRSGKVQKIVREVYLRQDIPCSSTACTKCAKIAAASSRHKGMLYCFWRPWLSLTLNSFEACLVRKT